MNLNRPGSAKETRHVELDLGESGLSYEVGDSLGVYPINCEELVDDLLRALGASGDEPVTTAGGLSVLLRDALSKECCLTEMTDELLNCLAEASPSDAEMLHELFDDDEPIRGCDVLDLLRRFPNARPAADDFVRSLALLRPRLYSISSSLKRHPNQVHLTVGKVTFTHRGRLRKGVASTMFADRLKPGDTVRVFVQKSHGFTIPRDGSTPMILIGPGTGIAPFRAFLQERAARGDNGQNWLFFGDQRRAFDFLYEDELTEFQRNGLLSRLETAFSRDQEQKIYVQHRIAEHGAELFRWLEAGAAVYVCGDAKRMAVDVDRALRDLVRAHGGMTPDDAADYIRRLSAEGRYCRDVY